MNPLSAKDFQERFFCRSPGLREPLQLMKAVPNASFFVKDTDCRYELAVVVPAKRKVAQGGVEGLPKLRVAVGQDPAHPDMGQVEALRVRLVESLAFLAVAELDAVRLAEAEYVHHRPQIVRPRAVPHPMDQQAIERLCPPFPAAVVDVGPDLLGVPGARFGLDEQTASVDAPQRLADERMAAVGVAVSMNRNPRSNACRTTRPKSSVFRRTCSFVPRPSSDVRMPVRPRVTKSAPLRTCWAGGGSLKA